MNDLQLLPKWIMKRYLILWKALGSNEFDLDKAAKILAVLDKGSEKDNKKIVTLFLSELRKAGWLEVQFDENDARKRIYRLKHYEPIFDEIVTQNLRGKER